MCPRCPQHMSLFKKITIKKIIPNLWFKNVAVFGRLKTENKINKIGCFWNFDSTHTAPRDRTATRLPPLTDLKQLNSCERDSESTSPGAFRSSARKRQSVQCSQHKIPKSALTHQRVFSKVYLFLKSGVISSFIKTA